MNEQVEACGICGQKIPVAECPYAWGCPKGIETEFPPMPGELLKAFEQVAELAGVPVARERMSFKALPAPHSRPPRLPSGTQAVYSFFLRNRCLKVGKAGPKSAARYCTQHYGTHARSTLARSVLAERNQMVLLVPHREEEIQGLNPTTVGPWLEANTRRLDFFLPDDASPFALALLETFLQARLRPTFEG